MLFERSLFGEKYVAPPMEVSQIGPPSGSSTRAPNEVEYRSKTLCQMTKVLDTLRSDVR